MSTNFGSIVLPSLFLIGWMQDPKGATSDPELANIPAIHGIAISWGSPVLTETLVQAMLPRDGTGKDDDSLRKELRLKDHQLTKLRDLLDRACDAAEAEDKDKLAPDRFFEIQEAKLLEGLPDVLTKPQMKRFEELHCQIEGLAILRVSAYGTRIGLSDDQRTKIRSMVAEFQKKADVHHGGIFSSRAGDDALRINTESLRSLAQGLDLKILRLLTARQKAAWKELVGETFKWEAILEPLDKRPDP